MLVCLCRGCTYSSTVQVSCALSMFMQWLQRYTIAYTNHNFQEAFNMQALVLGLLILQADCMLCNS